MKTRIFNLIILDASGSMYAIKTAAINSFNETVQTIRSAQAKHPDQEHFITLVAFNSDEIKTIYECVDVSGIKELTDSEYEPNCGTPLYDAMGTSIAKLKKKVAEDDQVLVTIITDGEENCSQEYNGKAIKSLVDKMKAQGWVFTYMGANQDVEKVAATISITNVLNFEATSKGTRNMMKSENTRRTRMYDRIAEGTFDAESENSNYFKD